MITELEDELDCIVVISLIAIEVFVGIVVEVVFVVVVFESKLKHLYLPTVFTQVMFCNG